MAIVTFRVIPQKNRTYHVELVRPDGSRRTITGFRSEHEAQAWGVQAGRMIDADRSWLARPAASSRTQAIHRGFHEAPPAIEVVPLAQTA